MAYRDRKKVMRTDWNMGKDGSNKREELRSTAMGEGIRKDVMTKLENERKSCIIPKCIWMLLGNEEQR